MKNSKIIVEKRKTTLEFYLISENSGKDWLFSQRLTKGVYEYFRKGRSESEIRSYRQWNRNPRLDKTITKLPAYIHYVRREAEYCH